MKKLDGDVLLGFSDFFEPEFIETTGSTPAPTQGLKVLGQTPPPPSRAISAAPASGGKTPPPPKRTEGRRPPTDTKKVAYKGPKAAREYTPIKQTTVMLDHGKVMKKARNTMSKAVYALTGKKPPELAKDTRTKGVNLKAAVVKGIASMTPTAPPSRKPTMTTTLRRGAGRVVMGTYEELVALGVEPKKVSPTTQAKLDAAKRKLEAATRKSNDLKKQLGAKTKTLLPTVRNLAKATVLQKKLSKALRTPGRTAVGQDPSMTDPTLTDPTLTDPTLTDLTAMDTGGSGGEISDADILDLLDSGALTPQTYAPDQFFEDYKAVNGILYKGEKGRPNGYVLSYGLLTRKTDEDKMDPDSAGIDGSNHWGFAWGVYDKNGPEKGIKWGSHFEADKWNHVHGAFHLAWDSNWHEVVDENFVLSHTPNTKAAEYWAGARGRHPGSSIGAPYGPLVGNDAYPDFKGMRVDKKGNMFWLPWEAPDWLTAPIRQASQVTKALEEKARKDADAAQALRDKLDAQERDRQKAAADFERAQQEAAAESEQKITTAKAEGEAATALVEEQKTATEQAKLDIEQQREMFKQQMAMMEEERRLMAMQAMQPSPYAYSEADEAYPGEPYGEYEPEQPAYDDGMFVPGGDIMRDEGGAGYGQFESDDL